MGDFELIVVMLNVIDVILFGKFDIILICLFFGLILKYLDVFGLKIKYWKMVLYFLRFMFVVDIVLSVFRLWFKEF